MAGGGVLEARTIPVGELSGQGTAVVAPDLRHCTGQAGASRAGDLGSRRRHIARVSVCVTLSGGL